MTRRRAAPARAVLGIDAAWTAGRPSGVALAVERGGRWTCAAVAPSYGAFVRLGAGEPVEWGARAVEGGEADADALVAAAARLAPGAELAAVAVDMPLAVSAIRARRPCDDALSRAFGARGLGVHTPSAARPGAIADRLHRALAERGFELATAAHRGARSVLEVYPHSAVLALTRSGYRVPYKLARAGRYWPDATPAVRRERIVAAWRRILAALRTRLAGIALPLPRDAAGTALLKRYEDALDAVVCAWVGIEFLGGRALAFGDADAAIWTPTATPARDRTATPPSSTPSSSTPSPRRPRDPASARSARIPTSSWR